MATGVIATYQWYFHFTQHLTQISQPISHIKLNICYQEKHTKPALNLST